MTTKLTNKRKGEMANKSLLSAVCTFLFSISTVATQPAFAVSSFQTDATRDTFSGTASDPKTATTGSILSEVIVPGSDGTSSDFSGDGYARGAADDTGAGAVAVDGLFFNGGLALNTLTATSILTSEITNTTGGMVPFSYDYFLPGPTLTISDFAGMSELDDPTISVFFDFRVSLDFGSGFGPASVVSQGILTGGYVSHTLDTAGTDPLGSTFFTDATYPNNIFGYQFDDLSGTVTGSLADGATVGVQSSLFVRLTGPGFETGGAANIGDPLNLSTGAFSGSLNIVPIPAAVWLFGSGLIGLIGIARRKRS
jgi:hypothetical protein